MKAVVLVVANEAADEVARLCAAALVLNGYAPDAPAVIDWPGPCCRLHPDEGCCDPNDCGPCCGECPTCPTLARGRASEGRPLHSV